MLDIQTKTVVQKRGINPSMVNSKNKTSTIQIRNIFNKTEAIPKVKILRGVVMSLRIGFKNEFIMPITIPIKTIICQSELISIPKNSEYPGIVLISTSEIK